MSDTNIYEKFEAGIKFLTSKDIPDSYFEKALQYTDKDKKRDAESDSVLNVSLEMMQKQFTL